MVFMLNYNIRYHCRKLNCYTENFASFASERYVLMSIFSWYHDHYTVDDLRNGPKCNVIPHSFMDSKYISVI